MQLNVLLTSYNRPFFLERALKSILAQKDDRWTCYVLDDGSDAEVFEVIEKYCKDERFMVYPHHTDEQERQNTTRYSVLINEFLPLLTDGIVGFLCDNVEYYPDLVGQVLGFFEQTKCFSGYVIHHRDMWSVEGKKLGSAGEYGHWDVTPPQIWEKVESPGGLLDHSQVFHRLPVDILWEEDVAAKKRGDALYFTQLVKEHGPIYCINDKLVLTTEHLFK